MISIVPALYLLHQAGKYWILQSQPPLKEYSWSWDNHKSQKINLPA